MQYVSCSLAEFTPQNANVQYGLGSLLHEPILKSVHSRLGNCTCNFKLRVWGRLNYLEDLLGQHKPCRTAGLTCGGGNTPRCWCSVTGVCSVQCGALGSHLVNPFLCGLFLGLTSLLWLFCFFTGKVQNQNETQPKCQDFLVTG